MITCVGGWALDSWSKGR